MKENDIKDNFSAAIRPSSTATPISNQVKGKYCPADCRYCPSDLRYYINKKYSELRYSPIEPIIINTDMSGKE